MENPSLIAASGTFKLSVGADAADVLDTGMPPLGEVGLERFLPRGTATQTADGVTWFADGDWRVGGLSVEVNAGHEAAAQQVYHRLLAATKGWYLARIWNHVPAINEIDAAGLENYRAFSRGRAAAFEAHLGDAFAEQVPSASGVGTAGSLLTVLFAVHRAPVRHVENPLQVPAYRYPADYGPRSPSFARATVAGTRADALVLISGTAAVRGHETIAPWDTAKQLRCTEENLREISRAAGAGIDLGEAQGWGRHFKVFVREAAEFARIQSYVTAHLVRPGDQISYVQSDICRAELTVEIEVSIGPKAALGQLFGK